VDRSAGSGGGVDPSDHRQDVVDVVRADPAYRYRDAPQLAQRRRRYGHQVLGAGELPAAAAVQPNGGGIQRRYRVPELRRALQDAVHQPAADALTSVLGYDDHATHSGHWQAAAMPPLVEPVDPRRSHQPGAVIAGDHPAL